MIFLYQRVEGRTQILRKASTLLRLNDDAFALGSSEFLYKLSDNNRLIGGIRYEC